MGQSAATGTASPAEITEGARKLARELDEFLAKPPSATATTGSGKSSSTTPADPPAAKEEEDATPMSEDAIADLQLQTARKLREVRNFLFRSDECQTHTKEYQHVLPPFNWANVAEFRLVLHRERILDVGYPSHDR